MYNIDAALGTPPQQPILVLSDNMSNVYVGSGASTGKGRHAMRRYYVGTCVPKEIMTRSIWQK